VKHQPVRLFKIDGVISDDKDIPRLKDEYYRLLLDMMREKGYAHVLDMGDAFSLDYNHQDGTYNFLYSVYGVYCGKEAHKIYGVHEGRKLYR
jgi:hypothetical protein